MNIIPIKELNISDVVEQLKHGKTLVYPTETVYGLGCDATNVASVKRIFDIKHRQKEKSVLVLMANIAMAKEYAVWSPFLEELASKYWPGPLTVVVKVKPDTGLAPGVIASDGTIAFRITDHPVAEKIAVALGAPLVSTSANIASMQSPSDIEDVKHMFEKEQAQPDVIIDAGVLPEQLPSTVVSVVDGQPYVLRQGKIVVDTIK